MSSLLVAGSFTVQAQGSRWSVLVPARQTTQEQAIVQMLVEETARRSADHRPPLLERAAVSSLRALPRGGTVMLLARKAEIASLLPDSALMAWQQAVATTGAGDQAEAFSVVSVPWRGGEIEVVAGNDVRGELFGAGWVLRHMSYEGVYPRLQRHLRLFEAPDKPVRGHQIGYRFKNNTYDAWTLPRFEQHIRDLAIFGTNTIQLIAPNSDDKAASPLFPAPPLETLLGISGLLAKYGLNCDLYYPEMRKNYSDPAQIDGELKDFEALVRAMPRLDALYVPGGDPGHTSPEVLLPLVERQAEILHRYHPQAKVWISAQGFDRDQYERFYQLLAEPRPWLTGVFFGPQSRDSFPAQRRRIPAHYGMQFYPDIAHTMHAQFPVPQWDPIFALTEGREPICPRPAAFAKIYRDFEPLHSGFITYSEGENDDVNKMVWSALGWSSGRPVTETLAEYARLFLHREGEQQQQMVRAIEGLEEDWNGPIVSNPQIAETADLFRRLESESTPSQVDGNGLWESLLYRAVYDDYVQRKLRRQRTEEDAVLQVLARTDLGASACVQQGRQLLAEGKPDEVETMEHDRLFALAGQLFRDLGLQLSVTLYGAANWERGANLDRVDTPLIESAWLNHAMDEALAQPNEVDRVASLNKIVHWQQPGAGAFYDDLGDPAHEPHLVRGAGWDTDPELYRTAIDGLADRTLADNWRLSWLDYAETLYERPLTLSYQGLDDNRRYRVRITYAGEDYALALRLTANEGVEIQPARLRSKNPETVEFAIPEGVVRGGSLTLHWTGPQGSGGSGRGRQVAEVWLLPESR